MNVVLDTSGYEVEEIIVFEEIVGESYFKERIGELKSNFFGDSREYFSAFQEKAKENALLRLEKICQEKGFDGIAELKFSSILTEFRSDPYVGYSVQALGLKKRGE